MQPSTIQLVKMHYLGIKVWPEQIEDQDKELAEQFDFNGVEIGEFIDVQALNNNDDHQLYEVQLRIAIENKSGKISPYVIDVAAYGQFVINSVIEKDKRKEMATVNGCAILYSAIREQVMTLSARCYYGALILPTVNFLDKKEAKTDDPKINKLTKKKVTRRAATKKS